MTQIGKIRQTSAEELAKWLMDDVEQNGEFTSCFCNPKFCRKFWEHPDGNFDCNVGLNAPDKDCIAAAVIYLNSEVKTP